MTGCLSHAAGGEEGSKAGEEDGFGPEGCCRKEGSWARGECADGCLLSSLLTLPHSGWRERRRERKTEWMNY